MYDARTDQISQLGLQYATKPGFYMVVGPNWKGDTPPGIAGIVRSSTDFAVTMPRIFMNDTPEDHAAIQPALSQIQFYPLSQFDGNMKTKDWSKLPKIEKPGVPAKYSTTQPPWVDPATFFEQLPAVMQQVPPMPGRKSVWNILLLALCFGGWLVCWYALFRLVWGFHTAIYPEHQFAEFWPRGIGMVSFVLSFLMMFSIAPAAMALGFMFGNVLIWLIPPARRVLETEARGYPGTSFVESMRGLFKICLLALPIGFAVALTAAYLLNSLR